MRIHSPARRTTVPSSENFGRAVDLASRPDTICVLISDCCDPIRRIMRQIEAQQKKEHELTVIEVNSAEELERHIAQHGGTPLLLSTLGYGKSFWPIARTRLENAHFARVPGFVDWMVNVSKEQRGSGVAQCVSSLLKWLHPDRFESSLKMRTQDQLVLPWGLARKGDRLIGVPIK